ncbi:MAG: gliding motility-associated C-terminal domain-containing protein [Paludibacter sp.]|nr:gliding motility-associated C-terminal domain-containing protein [Paludibacter sp.]
MLSRFRSLLLVGLLLTISSLATAQLAMPDNVATGATKRYYVDPNPIAGSTYIWSIDGVAQTSSVTNEIFIPWYNEGTFLLEVMELSNAGCYGELRSGLVTVTTPDVDFFIPEGFSPNGDGINDLFVIRGIHRYPANTFVIYNRWGNKVFEASPYQNTWDGRSMFGLRVGGDELPVGTYFYVLDLKDGSAIYKGTIYLNR